MKKLMILSAILLLVATAYGQRKASEAAREPDRRNERIRSGRTSATVHKKSTARHPEGSAASRRHPTAKVHSNQRHTRQLEARKPGNDQRRKYKTERNQPANRKQAPMRRDLQTRKFSGSHGNEKHLSTGLRLPGTMTSAQIPKEATGEVRQNTAARPVTARSAANTPPRAGSM